ncbi:hypothetical protein ACJX0J_038538, partial [Zea mays]
YFGTFLWMPLSFLLYKLEEMMIKEYSLYILAFCQTESHGTNVYYRFSLHSTCLYHPQYGFSLEFLLESKIYVICILLLPKFLPLNDHENKNLKLLEHKHLRARVQASSISYLSMKVYRAHTPRKNQYNIDVQQGQSELRNLSVVYTWQGHRLAATRENSECILLLPKFLPLNDHENKNLKAGIQ